MCIVTILMACAVAARAADDPKLSQNLASVIAAQGLKCGKVIRVRTQAEGDYLVACQDGSNYQVTADPQGKLVPHPLGMKIH